MTRGELREATAHAEEAARLDSKTGRPHLLLGAIRLRSGDYAGATAAWLEAHKLDPNFALTDAGFIRQALQEDELTKLSDHARRTRDRAAQQAVASVTSIRKLGKEEGKR